MNEETRQELVEEWLSNPITKLYFDTVKAAIRTQQEQKQFVLYEKIGEQVIPATPDTVALKVTYNQGIIDGLQEALNIEVGA